MCVKTICVRRCELSLSEAERVAIIITQVARTTREYQLCGTSYKKKICSAEEFQF